MSLEAMLREIPRGCLSLFLLAAVLLAAQPAAAAGSIRIGFVDMQRVMAESKAGKDASKQAERAQKSAVTKLEAEKRSIDKLQEAYKRDEAIMSDSQREERQKEIIERAQAYQKMAAELQQNFDREIGKSAGKALEQANEAIKQVAKEEGLQMIFEGTESGLLFAEPDLDLTDQVIRKVNR